MSPHEWLQSGDGRLLKLDATAHGDDHFFPGPCDIAWDLAGAIVEWNMDHRAKTLLLREYLKASGDDAAARIDAYVMAYTVFRFAWCKMAAAGMQGTDDEQRLLREYRKYSELAQRTSSVSTMR
jgi:thiamine kinase-like enzyme